MCASAGVRNQVMVNASDANRFKQHQRLIAAGERRIIGRMVENHLHKGRHAMVPEATL